MDTKQHLRSEAAASIALQMARNTVVMGKHFATPVPKREKKPKPFSLFGFTFKKA